jgi:hypothetical protein
MQDIREIGSFLRDAADATGPRPSGRLDNALAAVVAAAVLGRPHPGLLRIGAKPTNHNRFVRLNMFVDGHSKGASAPFSRSGQ